MFTTVTQAAFQGKRADPSLQNKKPFRTKSQKAEARSSARKCEDGTYRSGAPVSYHPAPKKGA